MRVIAGKYRRRQLRSLPGKETRPMLDRMRETLFNILQLEVPGVVFADLFSGTGAVGIEALSRGARQAILVEANPQAVKVIEDNLRMLGAEKDAIVVTSRVDAALSRIDADIWFLGPPYAAHDDYHKTLHALGEKGVRLAIAQHDAKFELREGYEGLQKTRVVKIGSNALSFFRAPELQDGSEP
jgi:16S rRNA (guanine(966)-N(2))-methyltransferase RsmD